MKARSRAAALALLSVLTLAFLPPAAEAQSWYNMLSGNSGNQTEHEFLASSTARFEIRFQAMRLPYAAWVEVASNSVIINGKTVTTTGSCLNSSPPAAQPTHCYKLRTDRWQPYIEFSAAGNPGCFNSIVLSTYPGSTGLPWDYGGRVAYETHDYEHEVTITQPHNCTAGNSAQITAEIKNGSIMLASKTFTVSIVANFNVGPGS